MKSEQREKTIPGLSSHQTAELLGITQRMIQLLGQRWEMAARLAGDPDLLSAPAHGLRREFNTATRSTYNPRDVSEYRENAVRARLNQPLRNWRKEIDHADHDR